MILDKYIDFKKLWNDVVVHHKKSVEDIRPIELRSLIKNQDTPLLPEECYINNGVVVRFVFGQKWSDAPRTKPNLGQLRIEVSYYPPENIFYGYEEDQV